MTEFKGFCTNNIRQRPLITYKNPSLVVCYVVVKAVDAVSADSIVDASVTIDGMIYSDGSFEQE